MTSARVTTLAIEQISLDALTRDSSPDATTDYVMTYDASAGVNKKVLLDNLGLGRRYKMIVTPVSYQTTSNVTPLVATELDFDVKANRTYRAKWYLAVNTIATTTGISYLITSSAGTLSGAAAGDSCRMTTHTINLNSMDVIARPISTTAPFTSNYSPSIKELSTIEMTFICSSNATISMSFMSEVSGNPVTVYRYSCVEYEELGTFNK